MPFLKRTYADMIGTQAYDSHCNLVLGDVEETVYVVDDDADDDEVKTVSKKSEMLFVRGNIFQSVGSGPLANYLDRRQRRADFTALPIMMLMLRPHQGRGGQDRRRRWMALQL